MCIYIWMYIYNMYMRVFANVTLYLSKVCSWEVCNLCFSLCMRVSLAAFRMSCEKIIER